MRRVIRAMVLLLCAGLMFAGASAAGYARVSDSVTFTYDDRTVRVKVYSFSPGDTKNHPVFKYGDLLNRATRYKRANPGVDVRVKFAIYKIGHDSYVGFDPNHSSYGFVKGSDHGGTHSEKLVFSLVKAARYQVHVDFVYHKEVTTGWSTLSYLRGFLDEPTVTDPSKKVGDYLRVRKSSWSSAASQQMHAKFMTVSHYLGDSGATVRNTTYVATANVDDHDSSGRPLQNWVNSGVLINGHSGIRIAYDRYFDLLYDYADHDISEFRAAVRDRHAVHGLNYDDRFFSVYFTPIPAGRSDAWDVNFNPVAKYVEAMSRVSGDRYLKVNVYHLRTDDFGRRLYDELRQIYQSSSAGLKHFRFVVKTNSYQSDFPLSRFNDVGIMKYPKNTHAKNVTFAFSESQRYYTLTGSTNLKADAHRYKANDTLVIKEYSSAHPIYSIFKEIYQYVY